MHLTCWSCGRTMSDLYPTCEFCGATANPGRLEQKKISKKISTESYEDSDASLSFRATLTEEKKSFGFWDLMGLLVNAVFDLIAISLVGGIGYVLFFTSLLTDVPLWITLPLKIYFATLGFLLYFKPSIVAWNLNRDLWQYSIMSYVFGYNISYAISVFWRVLLFPYALFALIIAMPFRWLNIAIKYIFDTSDVIPKLDFKALAKLYFFPQPWVWAANFSDWAEEGFIPSPANRPNPFYLTGIKARVQHRHFALIFFVNLIFGATGIIWLGVYVFAYMGIWMQSDDFANLFEKFLDEHTDF